MTLAMPINPTPPTPASVSRIVELAMLVAKRLALAELVQRADVAGRADLAAGRWTTYYNVRPMLETARYSAEQVCAHGEAIEFLRESGLIERYPASDAEPDRQLWFRIVGQE